MKVRLKQNARIRAALKQLTHAIDPATGVRRRLESLPALKARCPIENVVAHCLNQAPENSGYNELRFLCIWHDDHNPSLWVNIEKQRCGCHPCGWSGDVVDFVQKYFRSDFNQAYGWLRVWDYNYNRATHDVGRIRVRLPKRGRS